VWSGEHSSATNITPVNMYSIARRSTHSKSLVVILNLCTTTQLNYRSMAVDDIAGHRRLDTISTTCMHTAAWKESQHERELRQIYPVSYTLQRSAVIIMSGLFHRAVHGHAGWYALFVANDHY
jgi:hypothetical protein